MNALKVLSKSNPNLRKNFPELIKSELIFNYEDVVKLKSIKYKNFIAALQLFKRIALGKDYGVHEIKDVENKRYILRISKDEEDIKRRKVDMNR